MFEIFYKLKEFWNEYNFEIVICLLLLFFLIGALYQKITGKKGTWSKSYFYDNLKNYDKKYYDYDDKPKRRSGGGDSKGETECRRVLQSIFGRPFNKIRPNFLSNPVTDGGYNLEIDCYDHDLRLGIEYHGKQHYEFTPYFHKSILDFLKQKNRDEQKKNFVN